MLQWHVEDMLLLKEANARIYFGDERIYSWEHKYSRDEKIAFVDSLTDGSFSYLLELYNKYVQASNTMPKNNYGYVKNVSLKAFLKKYDTRSMIDREYRYGAICKYRYLYPVQLQQLCETFPRYTYKDVVDEVFHRQLKWCEQEEQKYFKAHDPYAVLCERIIAYIEKYHTTFGVNIRYGSKIEIVDVANRNNARALTLQELQQLVANYEQLEVVINRITQNTNITL